ncbi:ABC-type transport system involved in multi-copper enzyme maturation permease subunit [Povalibacter uvarum]|uniref:ABC-type transport system involved in multi-copper enzyme maturation permease subunit n=1 Tax=Povalibacter uvarum TaxID=732238 RepID=A0A841HS10_9GAMM|nr:M1 family aminopeptidase [Povalibacter uvarum]MBB6095089.1 ABC-type transport system involved in multi-copper enzyme maturation permease subunit [Povalibacter uvarum]
MLAEFFRFDLRQQLRSPLLWVAGLLFALFAFGATSSDFIQLGGAIGNVNRNAPGVIVNMFINFSLLGLFVVTFFIAQPLLRDFELGTDELFFSSPMKPRAYLAGRVLAGMVAALAIFVLTSGGLFLGAAMPWVDPAKLGPFSLTPHLWSFAVIVIPNLIFMTAMLSLLAVTARNLMSVYLGVIAFFILWLVANVLAQDMQYDAIASLLDPFGSRALERTMRYWSAIESNAQLPELTNYLLVNRAVWLAVSAVLLTLTFALFKPQRLRGGKKARAKREKQAEVAAAVPVVVAPAALPARSFTVSTTVGQFWRQLRFDTIGVLKSIPFLVLLAFGALNLGGGSVGLDQLFGTAVLPVTSVMLRLIEGSYLFLLILIVGFYAGELVWRERGVKLAELTDTLPVPNWLPILAKIGALTAVVVVFMLLGAVISIIVQLLRGYTNLELDLYVRGLFVLSAQFILMGAAAVVLQVVSNNKVVGYLLYVVVIIMQIAMPPMHLENNLYRFASGPDTPYSDMNGYGHFIAGWAWFQLYWALFTTMLVVVGTAFWVRGVAPSWRGRLNMARNNLRGAPSALLAGLALAFIGVGGWIYYNTSVVNEYLPSDVAFDRLAHYEREYRKLKDVPQPRIVDVKADVDIFPSERRVEIRGHYRLINKTSRPIEELHLLLDPRVKLIRWRLADAAILKEDPLAGYRLLKLRTPLDPGAAADFEFTIARAEHGFTNDGLPPSSGAGDMRSVLNYNGTFFNSMGMFPHFGYNEGAQLIDRNERRKRGLGDVPRMAKLEDEAARKDMGFPDADWINFETTVSTSEDQIALAPGYLQREWTENGRRYFHYKMDQPMLPFFCYLSARWEVKRDEWKGLPIEVYYDAKHPYNIDRMIDGTKKSLDYFTENFSPYQHKQMRILEFPRYARFAQSFANTVPYSESIGFIADLRKPENVDYVFYVTAHEVAHQWWAHQVIGAGMQGQGMLTESLSQYSAMMVMEKEYGREKMRKFLKYELDRYLRGRGGELVEELPLMRVEDQPYVHYQKGSLIFYRLRDEIGEENLNRALANFLRDKSFEQPPFTTTNELLDYIRAETPPGKHELLDELFAKIILYDNKVTDAKVTKLADGKYEVTMDVATVKREADGAGRETDLPVDDWMDVGVFARKEGDKEENERVLFLEKQHITADTKRIKVVVDEEPYEVGIDPYNKLIDRIPDDNRKAISD